MVRAKKLTLDENYNFDVWAMTWFRLLLLTDLLFRRNEIFISKYQDGIKNKYKMSITIQTRHPLAHIKFVSSSHIPLTPKVQVNQKRSFNTF